MNDDIEMDKDNLRYAEYVLGVLDADARAAVAREVASGTDAAAAVALWQRRLMPLATEVAGVTPPAHVWSSIRRRLGMPTPARVPWLRSLALWRWIGAGATAFAAAMLVVTLTRPSVPGATNAPARLWVSTLVADDGKAWWTATVDPGRSEAVVQPGSPGALAAGRDTQLWIVPEGGRPVSMGVFPSRDPKRLALTGDVLAQLARHAVLAVSLEPAGGSPTGQPTGPVIATGTIRFADR
ncbi:anti-sigma factor [Luteibacter sp. PPL201]|uniref:Anti-sigma factor n=1 Tax=Luteibacter sahnii TaxID=3021977 RepID=A0ABT6B8S5_9GAMM